METRFVFLLLLILNGCSKPIYQVFEAQSSNVNLVENFFLRRQEYKNKLQSLATKRNSSIQNFQ